MKIAIVHDWLTVYAGAEKTLEQILKLYPEADIFTIVDFLPEKDRSFLKDHKVTTSFIQKLPFAKRKYRQYLPLMPLAVEQFDMSAYDLIISSSHAVAKGVISGPDQKHICICYSPIRYAWDLQHQYLHESGLNKGLKAWLARYFLHKIRMWDYRTANGVDEFIAISEFISKRVWKVYRREATVIYPPVDVESFTLCSEKEDFYLTASRMVPYKKMDLIVEAFSQMKDKKLIVIGDGPDFEKIKAKAGENVILMGYQPFEVLRDHMQKACAFVFAAIEDFGITPIEAMACGTPVIALNKGGTAETLIDGVNGVHFEEQTIESISQAIDRFETLRFSPNEVRKTTLEYANFKEKFKNFVDQGLLND